VCSSERDYLGLSNVENIDYLDHMHARMYDPGMGRFLSVDPVLHLGFALRNPQSWNRHTYVLNNPLRFTDPTGRQVACANNPDERKAPKPVAPPPKKQGQSETTENQAEPPAPTGRIDKDKMVEYVEQNAKEKSQGRCAYACRKAFEAGGMNTTGRPVSAKDYGPFLLQKGAQVVPGGDSYEAEKGDVAVFDGNDARPHGHIQIFTGSQWVSDFKQNNFSPYRTNVPPSTIYRFPDEP
jgi:RHS repeat-associated protein